MKYPNLQLYRVSHYPCSISYKGRLIILHYPSYRVSLNRFSISDTGYVPCSLFIQLYMLLNRERHMANPVRTCGVWKERSSVDLILSISFSAECYMKIILFQEPITLGNVRDYSCTMSSSIYKQGDEEEVCMVQFQ